MWRLQLSIIFIFLVTYPSSIKGGSSYTSNTNNNNYDYDGEGGSANNNYGQSSPPGQKSVNCYREGYHPGSDCTKFIRCVSNGVGYFTKYDFDCGPGTVFDENLSLCNHPYMLSTKSPCYQSIGGAGGGQRSKSQTSQNTYPSTLSGSGQASGDRNLGRVGGRQLSDRRSSQNQRPPVFSVSTSRSSRVSSKSSSPLPTSSEDDEDGRRPEQFEGDWSSRTGNQKLGKSTHFEADDDVVPVENQSNDTTVWLDVLECPEAGFFPHPSNCSKFYRCLDYFNDGQNFTYVVFQFDCPPGQFFDESVYGCNLAENVPRPECQVEGNSTLTQEQMDMNSSPMCPVLISMPGSPEENLDHVQIFVSPILTPPRPEPMEVNQTEETTTTTTTSPRTNSVRSRTTMTSSTTTMTSSTTTAPPPSPPPPQSDQLLSCTMATGSSTAGLAPKIRANPFDCNKFYICSWTGDSFIIKVRQCPIGQIFVDQSQKCEDEATAPPCNYSNLSVTVGDDENGQNSTNSTESTTAEPMTELINGDNSCSSEGNFGIPDDCFRFYYCRRTAFILTALLMKCPENYHFSHGLCRKNSNLPVTCSQKPEKKVKGSTTNVDQEDDEDEGIWGNVGVPVPRRLAHLFIEQ